MEKLPVDDQYAVIASWSPDGNSLLLDPWPDGENLKLRIFDLGTRVLTEVPGSEGMTYSLWSPDGKYIAAAIAHENFKPMLYDSRTKTWREMRGIKTVDFWQWSRDSQYVYFDTDVAGGVEVMRYRVKDGRIESVTSLPGVIHSEGSTSFWFGPGPGDAPMIMRAAGSSQIYEVDWDAP